jgi:hypothetical protein
MYRYRRENESKTIVIREIILNIIIIKNYYIYFEILLRGNLVVSYHVINKEIGGDVCCIKLLLCVSVSPCLS